MIFGDSVILNPECNTKSVTWTVGQHCLGLRGLSPGVIELHSADSFDSEPKRRSSSHVSQPTPPYEHRVPRSPYRERKMRQAQRGNKLAEQQQAAGADSADMQIPNAVCSHPRNLLGLKNRQARDKMFQLSNHQRASNDRVQVGAFPRGPDLSASFAHLTGFAGYCWRRWCWQVCVDHPADSK